MQRSFWVIGYIFIGILVLAMAVNSFLHVSRGPNRKSQGAISFFLTEKLFAKNKTDDDKLNYVTLSYEALQKAETILSEQTPDTLSSSDLEDVVTALEQALSYAELIPGDVLDRIHPEMNMQFRQNYQAALMKMLNGFRNQDQKSTMEGYNFYKEYCDWVSSHLQ